MKTSLCFTSLQKFLNILKSILKIINKYFCHFEKKNKNYNQSLPTAEWKPKIWKE